MSGTWNQPRACRAALFCAALLLAYSSALALSGEADSAWNTNAVAEVAEASGVADGTSTFRRHSTALKRLEADLARALGLGRRSSSALPDAMRNLPPPTRARVSKDKEKDSDWIFKTPEELAKAPTAEEFLNLKNLSPEEKERKKLSSMERYFESMENQRALGVKSGKVTEEDLFGPKWRADRMKPDSRKKAEDDLISGISAQERSLRDILNLDSGKFIGAEPEKHSLREVFGAPHEGMVHQESFRTPRNFQELYGTAALSSPMANPFGAASGSPFNSPNSSVASGAPASLGAGLDSYLNPASMRGSSPSVFGSSSKPIFSPGGVQEAHAQSLNSWNPITGPQRIESPKAPQQTAPPSTFTIPQRSF